jgi:hypothetical protein
MIQESNYGGVRKGFLTPLFNRRCGHLPGTKSSHRKGLVDKP